jgi:hypothetical protein
MLAIKKIEWRGSHWTLQSQERIPSPLDLFMAKYYLINN